MADCMNTNKQSVGSSHLADFIRLNTKTVVWNQNADQLDLILLRTWVAIFLAHISTQLVNGGRIEFNSPTKRQIISNEHTQSKSTPYTWPLYTKVKATTSTSSFSSSQFLLQSRRTHGRNYRLFLVSLRRFVLSERFQLLFVICWT